MRIVPITNIGTRDYESGPLLQGIACDIEEQEAKRLVIRGLAVEAEPEASDKPSAKKKQDEPKAE